MQPSCQSISTAWRPASIVIDIVHGTPGHHMVAPPPCKSPVTPPGTNLLLFRWPNELFQCAAPHSVEDRGVPMCLRPALPIGDCGCMACSPHSAQMYFCWKDAVLARGMLIVEQSIRCHVSHPDRRQINGRIPLYLVANALLSGVTGVLSCCR